MTGPLRIAFLTHPLAFAVAGGGEQMLLTCREELQRRGHTVILYDQWRDRIGSFDVIHYFHCVGWECWPRLKAFGRPLVVTPTLWCERPRRPWLLREVRHALHRLGSPSWQPPTDEREIRHFLAFPDLLLPASHAEADRLTRHARVPTDRLRVVPNAVRVSGGDAMALPPWMHDVLADSQVVLCVGSFHAVKNQLALIEALDDTPVRVMFIGDPSPEDTDDYLPRCKAAARGRHWFVGVQPHEVVLAAMKVAGVYVQPSLRETCGLAALEAAGLGCRVAITEQGATREYFDDLVSYCNPRDRASIRSAVLKAVWAPAEPDLSELVRHEYSVKRLGGRLEAAYTAVTTLH